MKSAQIALLLAAISVSPALAQDIEPAASSTVAHVYVQTHSGVMSFAASTKGQLTTVHGSPFSVSGQIGGSTGSYLISIGTDSLHTYPLKNGVIGKSVAQNNTQYYYGSECGNNTGATSVFDHSGKYFYVQLSSNGNCAAMQSYKLESNGYLQFIGAQEYSAPYDEGSFASTNPTIAWNDKLAYGVFNPTYYNSSVAAYSVHSGELEENYNFYVTMPQGYPDGEGWNFFPYYISADPYGDLAAVVYEWNENQEWDQAFRLASFSINPSDGGIYSNQDYYDMPYVYVGNPIYAMNASPSGVLMAVAGSSGLQVFHFNQAQPLTSFTGTELSGIDIEKIAWDNSNHLYALSYGYSELFVFTVTPTSFSQAPGSPYYLPSVYGNIGLIVTK